MNTFFSVIYRENNPNIIEQYFDSYSRVLYAHPSELLRTSFILYFLIARILIIQAPLAIKFGRRPVYLLGATLFFTCSIWSAVSQGLDSFTGSRALQGFGMAPFEALVTATIADIFFVSFFFFSFHTFSIRVSSTFISGSPERPSDGYLELCNFGWDQYSTYCEWLRYSVFPPGMEILFLVCSIPPIALRR